MSDDYVDMVILFFSFLSLLLYCYLQLNHYFDILFAGN
jgi:hypothetical protein